MPNVTTVKGPDVDPGRPFLPSFEDYTKPGLAECKDGRLVRESERRRVAAETRTLAPLPAWRLTRVVRYVDARLDQKIRLADLAKEVRLSRMHFAAQFNAATGLSPLEYVTRRRITRAQEFLVRSEQSIVQIALAVGFQTQAHFTTVFRRFVGETPYRWRMAMTDSPCDGAPPADVQRAMPPVWFAGGESSAADPNRHQTAAAHGLHLRGRSSAIRVRPRRERSSSDVRYRSNRATKVCFSEAGSMNLPSGGDGARATAPGQFRGSAHGAEGVAGGDDPRGHRRLALLEQAIAGASHDINHIVTCMIATMELIALRARSGAPAGIEALIEEGRFAGERASRLAGQMMDYTRPVRAAPCPVNVNQVINRNRSLLCRALGNAAICRLNLRQDLLPAWCNAAELERALLNLVINAREAVSGREGTVTLETCNAALADPQGGLPPGNYVCIAVSDNGSGMPDDVLKRAFEPFVTTKARGRGAGLGLALVHRFIDHNDGHVDIESAPGVGTVIRMYLPAHLPPSAIASGPVCAGASA